MAEGAEGNQNSVPCPLALELLDACGLLFVLRRSGRWILPGRGHVGAVPGVADGRLGFVPVELAARAGLGPAALQVGFDVIEALVRVPDAPLPAVPLSRPVFRTPPLTPFSR